MSGTLRDLNQIQRWMQAVIMHPEGVIDGLESEAAQRELDLTPEDIEKVLTRSQALSAAERLGIYNGAYYARLLECLREEYPVFRHAVGEDSFDEFAVGYLQKYPSRSYTLNRLGANFPRYLAETCPAEEPGTAATSWPGFLIDLAILEWTYSEVFDGSGVEGEQLLDVAELLAVPPQRWPDVRLVLVPCFRLVRLRYPVHEYYTAVRKNEEATPPVLAETFLAITRRNHVVRRYALTRPQYQLLSALAARESLAEAIGQAAVAADAPDPLAADLRQWFSSWAAEGFFRAIEVPD